MRLLAAANAAASGNSAKVLMASMRRSKSYNDFGFSSATALKCEAGTLHIKAGVDQIAGILVRQQQGGLGDALADAAGLDLIG